MAFTTILDSNPLAADQALYHSAIVQGAAGLSQLGKAALDAVENGRAEPSEGLTIAGLFYRMAAEREQPATGTAHAAHAEVMLRRERIEREAGKDAFAIVSGAFALRALNRAADTGNEAASTRLSEIAANLLHGAHSAAQSWARPEGAAEQAYYDNVLRLAGEGDAVALIGIITEAIADEAAGALGSVEMLAICEQVGRLGAAAGHGELTVRLCGALLSRAGVERLGGKYQLAADKEVDGIGVIARAAQMEHPGADDLLARIAAIVPASSLTLAVRNDPTILAVLPVQGIS